MKKILRSKKRIQKNNVFLVCALSSLAACNNDSKKILGLAGNAASEGIEKLFEVSPVVSSNYIISTTNPESSKGDGTNSLPIEVSGAVIASPIIVVILCLILHLLHLELLILQIFLMLKICL